MKIVFLDVETVGGPSVLGPIARLGDIVSYPRTKNDERFDRCLGADILITNKVIIDKPLIDRLPDLMLICIAATGMNCVDLEYARSRGIEVKNIAGYSTHSVAQHTFAMLLGLLHGLPYYDNYVKSGKYCNSPQFTHLGPRYFELHGKTFGIIGLGEIGRQVATIASAFGARVIYYSTSGKNNNSSYQRVDLDQLLKTSDIVSIHAPLNDLTHNLIGERELRMMQPHSVLLNTGRGGIVNEMALALAVDEEIIAGAATDVFEREPIPVSNPFLQMKHKERMVLTPHVAWTSKEAMQRLIYKIAENISNFQAGIKG
jgi:lactate dehydrogenase-like 2-hydroxyacid dehydrogenase